MQNENTELILVAHNLRSAHNVGSILRTAEGLGVNGVLLTGYTPYPQEVPDRRLPHIAQKIDKAIHKTALGAEHLIWWQHYDDITEAINALHERGFMVAALEQTDSSQYLTNYIPPSRLALIVGREVEGIESDILKGVDVVLQIPMSGKKESFNVAVAAAMALYHFTYINKAKI